MLGSILFIAALIFWSHTMPVYDPAILNLVRAGQKTAANDAIAESHPANFLEYTGSLAEYIDNFWKSTSGSSATIGTGTKVFTLSETRGWPAGTPVYITEDGDPEANFMVGTLDSDETSEGVISVTVTGATGSGTFTAWTLRILHSATSVASPPLGVADGGTGGTTAATARAGLGIGATRHVVQWANAPSVIEADRWYATGPAPTGDFAGQANKWAFYDGVSYTFETPEDGDAAICESDTVTETVAAGSASGTVIGYASGGWGRVRGGWQTAVNPQNTNITITAAQIQNTMQPFQIVKNSTATPTYTLPSAVNQPFGPVMVIVQNTGASGNITVNVASAGTINGSASLAVTPGQGRLIVYVTTGQWQTAG